MGGGRQGGKRGRAAQVGGGRGWESRRHTEFAGWPLAHMQRDPRGLNHPARALQPGAACTMALCARASASPPSPPGRPPPLPPPPPPRPLTWLCTV